MLVVFVLRLESIYSEELTMTLEARSRAFFQEYVTFVGLAKRLNDFWTKQKHTLKEVDHLLRGHKGYGAYMFHSEKKLCSWSRFDSRTQSSTGEAVIPRSCRRSQQQNGVEKHLKKCGSSSATISHRY